jgi:hypothetical protein
MGDPLRYMLTIKYVNVKVQKFKYEWVQKEEKRCPLLPAYRKY